MGLYDMVICDAQLPDWCAVRHFQTKDLHYVDGDMSTYRITAGGRLLLVAVIGNKEAVEHDMEFDGSLNFYAAFFSDWYEYRAKFTDGNLVEIRRVE